jgi:hypothetical protein
MSTPPSRLGRSGSMEFPSPNSIENISPPPTSEKPAQHDPPVAQERPIAPSSFHQTSHVSSETKVDSCSSDQNEKHHTPGTSSHSIVWPPWKREDGWTGWRNDWVRKEALVVPLIVQAFSAGVLDATTYADFMTFASNRESTDL